MARRKYRKCWHKEVFMYSSITTSQSWWEDTMRCCITQSAHNSSFFPPSHSTFLAVEPGLEPKSSDSKSSVPQPQLSSSRVWAVLILTFWLHSYALLVLLCPLQSSQTQASMAWSQVASQLHITLLGSFYLLLHVFSGSYPAWSCLQNNFFQYGIPCSKALHSSPLPVVGGFRLA